MVEGEALPARGAAGPDRPVAIAPADARAAHFPLPPESMRGTRLDEELPASARRCATCGAALRGRYCHACGERALEEGDLRVRAFVARAVSAVFDTDSRLWRTFHTLIRRPGHLTAEFVSGRRRPYLHPLQTFLLANLVFFGVLSTVGGFNTFTTPLRYHVGQPVYGEAAQALVDRRVESGSPAAEEYHQRFDETTPGYANTLVILMVPVYALLVALLYLRRRPPFVQHFVLSLHFMAFVLLVLTLLPFLVRLALLALPGTNSIGGDGPISLALLVVFTLYLAAAMRRAYGDPTWISWIRGLAGALMLVPAVTVYRMILFFAVHVALGVDAREEGQLPEYDVEAAEVEVTEDPATVPDIDVREPQ